MGFVEARTHEQVVTALEEAIEAATLSPGTPGFRRRQAEVADLALQEPLNGGDGCSRLEAVHAERLEHWLKRGHTRGSPQRRAILEPIAKLLANPPHALTPEAAHAVLGPALWLLELGVLTDVRNGDGGVTEDGDEASQTRYDRKGSTTERHNDQRSVGDVRKNEDRFGGSGNSE